MFIYHLCPLQSPGGRYLLFRISPDTDAVRRIRHHMLLTGISEHRSHFIIKKGINMNITVLAVGKLKEKYWTDAIKEYSRRISRYASLNIIELKESLLRGNPSAADEEAVKIAEGREILSKIKKTDYVITLEIAGKALSSEKLAEKIETLGIDGISDIVFVIGGSLGLSVEVSRRADFKLSFSAMTFPHQMMRVILLEQIYRSFKIIRHEAYHK